MDKFIKMNSMHHKPTNKTMSIALFSKMCYNGAKIEVFRNSTYQVIKRAYKTAKDIGVSLVWLSIKRIDKEPIHDWRELQEIKNELVGKSCEGVELYPAEDRVVDLANQYHLWVIDDPKYRFPFGFSEGLVSDSDVAESIGAKQRPL